MTGTATTITDMHDHPGWRTLPDGRKARAFRTTAGIRGVVHHGPDWTVCGADTAAAPDVIELGDLPGTVPGSLARCCRELGAVRRWPTPDLWEALATAVIRQVIQAAQARRLYQRFCDAHGPAVQAGDQGIHALPGPDTVLGLPDSAFADLGLAFKAKPLRAVAEAVVKDGERWAALTPGLLLEEVQQVPRIGPWTAGAAVADAFHAWDLYPYGDLAVRKWAAAADPDTTWPTADATFAAHWQQIAGQQLGPLTLFTLTWGVTHGGSL